MLCAKIAFHGLTAGALSLMSDAFWREGFGPLLADAAVVPFGDLAALEKQLSSKRFGRLWWSRYSLKRELKSRRKDI